MKLTIKSLKQVPYELEVESDAMSILELKKEFEKLHGFDNTTVKLVFAGAILDDSKTLAQCNIKDGNVIVMMSAKAKPVNTQKEEAKIEEKPVQQSSTTVKQEQPVQQKTQSQPKKEKDYSEQIKNLMDMGFPKNEAESAIKAARGDVNVAIEFLYNGIPDNFPAEDEGEVSDSPNAVLKGLASLVKIMCYNNPSQLQNILLSIQQNSPESFDLIRQNEEEFKNLIQQPITDEDMRVFQQFNQQGDLLGGQAQPGTNTGGSSTGGQRRDVIKLSKEDYEAVNRLKEMGFSEMDAVQAYFACDKNEDLAANLLFDNKLKEQENEIYIDCNII
jgi:UV excision repair protein RAD23